MNASEESRIHELLRQAFAGDVPAATSERMQAQLADLRTRLATRPSRSRAVRPLARPAWWGLGLATAACVIVAVAVGLALRARVSFAEVAAAAFARPWIHVQLTRDGKPGGEIWQAPALMISASRFSHKIEYQDYRLEVDYSYEPKEQILYRLPRFTEPRGRYESMALAIMELFKAEQVDDKPLDRLNFLGPERDQMKLLNQEMTKVTEDGHQWLDYRLTVSYVKWAEPMRMFFRADAVTKLPALCRYEGSLEGKAATAEARFDYPQTGPADIFALGVPREAKLVDRVPAGDLKPILAALQAGRERMDDYRAVFVFVSESDDYFWLNGLPEIEYRKGYNFRTDQTTGWIGDEQARRQDPGKIDDLDFFWRERAKSFRFYPSIVMRGATQYWSETKYVTDADGSEHADIVSVDRFENGNKPSELFPPDWSTHPEFACRPPMGIGDPHQQPELDLHPIEGPAGCILLSVAHTSDEGRINEKGFGSADENRFWLDPEHDYIVMRWDMLVRDKSGKLQIHESNTMEEIAQSPRGVWYAKKIRRWCPEIDAINGKREDQIYHIYVDFDVDLPDSLFDPPRPGRIE